MTVEIKRKSGEVEVIHLGRSTVSAGFLRKLVAAPSNVIRLTPEAKTIYGNN